MTIKDETADALRALSLPEIAAKAVELSSYLRNTDEREASALVDRMAAALSDRATDREGECKGCNGLGYNVMAPQTTWQGGERVPCVVCKGHPPIFTASFPARQPIADLTGVGPSADDLEADGKAMWQGPQPIEGHAKYRKGRPWVPLEAAIADVQFWQRRDYESGQTIATLKARLAQAEGERDALREALAVFADADEQDAEDEDSQLCWPTFTVGDFRRARAALADPQAGGKGGAE